MGITIHYAGKAKGIEAIDALVRVMTIRASVLHWPTKLIDQDLKGKLYPNWGHGYEYVPSKEEMKEDKIEFFPKMVRKKCNGYFEIFDTTFSKKVRNALRRGKHPEFHINTHTKGITLYPHKKCEALEFVFDLKTMELVSYETWNNEPGIVYGYDPCSCRTQFSNFRIHALVCETIRCAEKYINFSEIRDDTGYYRSKDLALGAKNFNDILWSIREMEKILNEIGREFGSQAKVGDR